MSGSIRKGDRVRTLATSNLIGTVVQITTFGFAVVHWDGAPEGEEERISTAYLLIA